jgi:hypothetical protein
LTLGGKSYKKLKTDTHPIMHFNPNEWNCHRKGKEARRIISENLPANIDTLCQLTGLSRQQVQRHLATIRAEQRLKAAGLASVAPIGFCLLIPDCATARS